MDPLPPANSLYSLPNAPLLDQVRPTFRSSVQEPIKQFARRSSDQLRKVKEPGFVTRNAQLIIITIFGVIFYTLCVVHISKKKEIPIVLGLITTAFMLYFVYRYHQTVPIADHAVAGWVLTVFLAAAIGSMSFWINETK